VAYVRTVKTSSGATAVQIVFSTRRGSREIEHIGSAHDEHELEALKAVARQRLARGQGALDLGLDRAAAAVVSSGPLPITSSRMSHLWDALSRAYDLLGFAEAAEGDDAFRQLVLARIIEPTSKQDSLRVLAEVGIDPVSYRTMTRRLPVYANPLWRQRLAAACATHTGRGPASLVLFDVSTLYFETDAGDGFREPGFSKAHRPAHARCVKDKSPRNCSPGLRQPAEISTTPVSATATPSAWIGRNRSARTSRASSTVTTGYSAPRTLTRLTRPRVLASPNMQFAPRSPKPTTARSGRSATRSPAVVRKIAAAASRAPQDASRMPTNVINGDDALPWSRPTKTRPNIAPATTASSTGRPPVSPDSSGPLAATTPTNASAIPAS
jgi:hypothetical protein